MKKSRAKYLKVWKAKNKKKVQAYRADWYKRHKAEQNERTRNNYNKNKILVSGANNEKETNQI